MNYINGDELNFLFHVDYHDGPLNGVLEYQDGKYWYEMMNENTEMGDDGRPARVRTFGVYQLTHEQMEQEISWQQFFEDKIEAKGGWHESDESDRDKYASFSDDRPEYHEQNECVGLFQE